MELTVFRISRFRLFVEEVYIDLKSPTILIGPNNEGKSTICDALNIFFSQGIIRRRLKTRFVYGPGSSNRGTYDILRDYPMQIHTGRRWPTEFKATFKIEQHDQKYLPDSINKKESIDVIRKWSYENEEMTTEIEGLAEEQVIQVIRYINRSIKFVLVPAIREERTLGSIFEQVFNGTIESRISNSRKISTLKKDLKKLLVPEIKKSIKSINSTLVEFMKKDVKVDFNWDISISRSISLEEITAHDGNLTNIGLKGDGIKSLMTMALLTQYAEIETDRKASKSIYIIEEPEAHLNSSYLYILKEKLDKLSKNSTLIITTHSSIFANFGNVSNNQLVAGGKISTPKNKSDIALALGVQLNENLKSNSNVIYVEGYDDTICLDAIFEKMELLDKLKENFDVIYAEGASKLCSLILSNRPFFSNVYVLIDNDKEGNDALKVIKQQFPTATIFITPLSEGFKESEIEDMLTLECQSDIFHEIYNRDFSLEIMIALKKKYRQKWSNWIKRLFNQVGIQVDDIELIKRNLWSKKNQFEFNDEGKIFLETIIKSLKII
jgi:predicted ATP-dependent endonuclease of OLD family